MNESSNKTSFVTDSAIDTEIIKRRKMKYNCAAATLCGVNAAAELGHDEETLKNIVAGFGGGIGRTNGEGTCGALTGAVAGLGIFGNGDNARTTELAKDLFEHFKQQLGSVQCGVLKSAEHRTPCNLCCLIAGRKLHEIAMREGFTPKPQVENTEF